MNIAHLLRRSAQLYPDQPAMHHGEHVLWSYAALGARTASLAASLRARWGVAPGDRVAIYAANTPEYLEALHAIVWAGAVSVPVNTASRGFQLQHILSNSGARLLVIEEELGSAAVYPGKAAFILPCLGRAEVDEQATGNQAVTSEDSF